MKELPTIMTKEKPGLGLDVADIFSQSFEAL